MSIHFRFLTCAAIVMAGVSLTPIGAFALPSSPAVAIETSAPARAEQIRWRRGWGWGVGAGVVGGVIIGRALTAPYYEPYYPRAYYPGPAYYADGYYPGRYREAPVIEDVEEDDVEAYCIQRFRSYDPESGTYLGYDGLRHPCPG
jgi:hypothetical protein